MLPITAKKDQCLNYVRILDIRTHPFFPLWKRKQNLMLAQAETTTAIFPRVEGVMFHNVLHLSKKTFRQSFIQSMNRTQTAYGTCQPAKQLQSGSGPKTAGKKHNLSFTSAAVQEEETDAYCYHPEGGSSL